MDVVVWVSGLLRTFGNTQLPTCVWEFIAALFPASPLAKKCIGTAFAAALELPVCPEFDCLHVKLLLKLSVYIVDYISVAFYLGRLLCS